MMGLFSRDNQGNNSSSDFLDEVDLPSSTDLNEEVFSSESQPINIASGEDRPTMRSRITRPTLSYGVEDAIKLMRSLPRDNNEVVVTVVKKTLESTQIQVSDIVSDADSKEERIRDQHKTLENEIKQLQEQIAQRNQQITDLLKDLKETTDVRERLQLAMELDIKNTPKKEKAPEAQKSNAVKTTTARESTTDSKQSKSVDSNVANSAGGGSNSSSDPATYASNANAQRSAGHRNAS